MPTKDRIIRFHALLRETQTTENKADMVGSFGVESTKDLSNQQIDVLIAQLIALRPASKEVPQSVRKARHVVLCLLSDLGVMKHPKDWDSVNVFLEQPRIFGKRLNKSEDVEEITALQRKLRSMLKKQKAKIDIEDYQATNN